MCCRNLSILISFVVLTISCSFALADCPSADLTGDCWVDFEDFAVMAGQWLTGPNVPDDMVQIPAGGFYMGDPFFDGNPDELPVHEVYVDSFYMSIYEITNQQYCDYLNSADVKVVSEIVYATSDSNNSYPYCRIYGINPSQIEYSGCDFSVHIKGDRDMSDDPMVYVTWYGAAAYCNWRSQQGGYQECYNTATWECDFSKHGYRLATEAEWEYAARGGEHSPYYRFPWGNSISHSQANYYSYWEEGSPYYTYDLSPTEGFHPDWNDGIMPYTSVVGSFAANGYGLCDMAGNTMEWCNDWYLDTYYSSSPVNNPTGPSSGSSRVLRDGSWGGSALPNRCAYRCYSNLDRFANFFGFRVVLDLE